MVDVVVIEAPAMEVDPTQGAILVASCTASLSSGSCAFGGGAEAPVVATITFDADGTARIRLRGPGGEALRTLRFGPVDEEAERWRSVGLVIGTVADGLRASPQPPPPKPESPPDRPPPRPEPDVVAPPPPPLYLDLGVLLAPALDDGTWRGGPVLRAAYSIAALPLTGVISMQYAYRGRDDEGLAVHWLGAGGGLGIVLRLLDDALWLDARAEVIAHLIAADATEPGSGAEGSASRWLPGGRFGAGAAWMLHRNVGAFLGLDGTVVPHGTQLRISGEASGRAPPYEIAPQVGVRAAFP